MKYALLNNKRIEPQKGIKDAVCPVCGEIMIPCCGDIKMHYWRHKLKQNCDSWWENETEWHRQWKDNFPKECQEIIMHDEKTGEKHVADVKTKTGIVLEFQHSQMDIEEQISREQFYKNMIWVVDARKYYDRLKKNLKNLNKSKMNRNYFYLKEDVNFFPKKWLKSNVPVIFDYGIHNSTYENYDKQKKWLWCIFPEKYSDCYGYYITSVICGFCIKKDTFVNRVSNSNNFYPNILISELEQNRIKQEKEESEQEKKRKENYRKYMEKIKLYEKRQKKLFEEKYLKEKIWRDAILNVKIDIELDVLNPEVLYISENSKILDKNGHNYSGNKCIILGKNLSIKEFCGDIYRKNIILLLVQNNNEIFPAAVEVPSSILNGAIDDDSLKGNSYNYYIRTIKTSPYWDKQTLWFEDADKISMTSELKCDLEYIKSQISNYQV